MYGLISKLHTRYFPFENHLFEKRPEGPQRIIDYIPLAIEHELSQSLAINFRTRLFESLLQQPNAADKMKTLWSEDPALAKRRSFLQERQARLIQIKQRLDDFRERRE